MVSQDAPFQSPESYFEMAYRKWVSQWDDLKGVEAKAATLFTIGSAGLIATLAVVRMREQSISNPILTGAIWLAGLSLFVLVIAVLMVVRPVEYTDLVKSEDMRRACAGFEEPIVRVWAADAYLAAVASNRPKIARKENAMVYAWAACGIETLLLAGILIFS